MQALLDTNILLAIFRRQPGWEQCQDALDWLRAPGRKAWVTWPTVATLAYFLEKDGWEPAAIRAKLRVLKNVTHICPAPASLFDDTLALPMDDFEDAMQSAFAESCGADVIITRNITDFAASPVPAMTPEAFLARHAQRF